MSAFASCCLLPTCRGLADKVGQVSNLGYHFPAYLPWFSEILLSGDAMDVLPAAKIGEIVSGGAMDVLPAAKIGEIVSGGQCKESYHAYQPQVTQ